MEQYGFIVAYDIGCRKISQPDKLTFFSFYRYTLCTQIKRKKRVE